MTSDITFVFRYKNRCERYGVDEAPDYGDETDPSSPRYTPLYDFTLVAWQVLNDEDKAFIEEVALNAFRAMRPHWRQPLAVQRIIARQFRVYVSKPTMRYRWYEVLEQEEIERREQEVAQ